MQVTPHGRVQLKLVVWEHLSSGLEHPYDRLEISDVDESNAGWYSMVAHTTDGRLERRHYKIVVKDGMFLMTSWHGNVAALLTLCDGNPPWPVDSHHKGTEMLLFVSFGISLNSVLSKHSSCRWFETTWRSRDVTVLWRVNGIVYQRVYWFPVIPAWIDTAVSHLANGFAAFVCKLPCHWLNNLAM